MTWFTPAVTALADYVRHARARLVDSVGHLNISVMLQDLSLPPGQQGRIWFYASPRNMIARHRHVELEFNLVLQGHARYLTSHGTLELGPQSGVWLFPGQEHVLVDTDPNFRMWIIVWRPELLAELCAEESGLPVQLSEDDPAGTWLRRLGRSHCNGLSRLCEDIYAEESRTSCINAGLAWLLVKISDAFAGAELLPTGEAAHPAVRQALYLLASEEPPVDLPSLASACNLSPDRLGRLFHRDTGQTVSAYRNRLRCERAGNLMLGSDDDLTEIALAAGFGSYTHFHKVFSAVTGEAPGRWREHHM